MKLISGYQNDRTHVRWIFLRSIALLSFISFWSLYDQSTLLFGSDGLIPLSSRLKWMQDVLGLTRFYRFPTLIWFLPSLAGSQLMMIVGMVCSGVLFFGFYPRMMVFFLWVLYLSLNQAGFGFMSYGWDLLLIETLFFTIWVAPVDSKNRANIPGKYMVFLFHLLVLKLFLFPGLVKLITSEQTWNNLTAIKYFLETQPLPTPLAWGLHQMPGEFLKVVTVMVLVVELVLPIFIFSYRKLRIILFYVFSGFQLSLMLCGNFGPFNLLSIVTCFWLLDDKHLRVFNKYLLKSRVQVRAESSLYKHFLMNCSVVLVVLINLLVHGHFLFGNRKPGNLKRIAQGIKVFRTVNTYSMFGTILRPRKELIFEGSLDGDDWKRYDFAYKPDSPFDRPKFVAPFVPRLERKLHFNPYNPPRDKPWFSRLMKGLIKERKVLLKRLNKPIYNISMLRVRVREYSFSSLSEFLVSGKWWREGPPKLYAGPYKLDKGSLTKINL